MAFSVALLVVVEGGISLQLTGDPLQTVGFILVVVGAGIFMLSAFWTGAVVASGVAVWSAAAVAHGLTAPWLQFGMTPASACLLGAVAQAVRLQTYERLEIARRHDEAQRVEILRSRAHYRSIVENSPAFIMRLDADGRVRSTSWTGTWNASRRS